MTASSNEPDPIQPQSSGSQASDTGAGNGIQSSDSNDRTADVAKDKTRQVTQSANQAARGVAATAKEQGASVTQEVRDQARRLGDQTRTRLSDQALSERDRAVDGLRAMSQDLQGMADRTEGSGIASQLADRGAHYTRHAADYLAGHEPGQLVDDVRRLARRRPALFLLGAAMAGVVSGRLSRGAVQAARESGEDSGQAAAPAADDITTSSMGTATTADPAYGADDASVVAGPAR